MASNTTTQAQFNQGKRTSFSGFQGGNAAMLLEKTKTGIRRSTPDSEALASSDDEQEHHQMHSMTNSQASRPARRSSWLNEVQQVSQRKGSLSGSGTFSPASSHPATPAADSTSWASNIGPSTGSTLGRSHANSTSFPWGSAIWGNDSQKGPPARLTEVLPSPTSVVHPGSAGLYSDDPLASPPISRDGTLESAIPFAIPLHPTPKTYRSQSYSVGQLDPETVNTLPGYTGNYVFNGRIRAGSSYAGLQHRPSRPSMLGDLSHDTSVLGQLREVDDDDESSNSSEAGVQLSNTQARTIEQLAMENALLRQAAANQFENGRLKNRAAPIIVATNGSAARFNSHPSQLRIAENPTEEVDYTQAVLENLSVNQVYSPHGTLSRRFSEYSANPMSPFSNVGTPENRKLESIKKGHWQSSLGFGGLAEAPQSRRHSFADVPTRHGSIGSAGDPQINMLDPRDIIPSGIDARGLVGYGDGLARPSQGDNGEYAHFRSRHSLEEQTLELEHLRNRNFAASYFSTVDPATRNPELYRPSNSPSSLQQLYTTQSQYGRSQHLGHSQPHHTQLLFMVTFKACRAEVYYVQEGTGLQVKTGDLVIVEADRGTDLGTVAHENITWAAAKDLKEYYIEEHYKWLMMFSRHGQNGSTVPSNPNAPTHPSSGAQVSAIGGMGPPGQSNSQDVPNVELKPKMIKRLAQAHEIQTLRDKEGNEAKAKRVCQQKVVEHRLNMEILDAEFQMDWKKLTFYYFADSYINFNSLVTDLFKIYKTRIWMSAINPASFVTPTAGLQLPASLRSGAIPSDGDHYPGSGFQKEVQNYSMPQVAVGPFDHIWSHRQDIGLHTSNFPNAYAQSYRPNGFDSHHITPELSEYSRSTQQGVGPHPSSVSQGYTVPDIHRSTFVNSEQHNGLNNNAHAHVHDWNRAFQGLSLGS